MSTKLTNIILVAIVAVSFGIAFFAYPTLPDIVASHWDFAGNVNGHLPKFWALLMLPLGMLVLLALYFAIPVLDPHHKNIESFRKEYNVFWIVLMLFFAYIFKFVLIQNSGIAPMNENYVLAPALAVLIFTIGWILPKTKRNWFIGIRTPWTLSSDAVWDKTHKLGGILFKLSALGPLVLFFMPNAGDIPIAVLLAGPILLSTVITIIYSFIEFKKEQR